MAITPIGSSTVVAGVEPTAAGRESGGSGDPGRRAAPPPDRVTISPAARELARQAAPKPGDKFELKLSPEALRQLIDPEKDGLARTPAPGVARDVHPQARPERQPRGASRESGRPAAARSTARDTARGSAAPAGLKPYGQPADSTGNREDSHGY